MKYSLSILSVIAAASAAYVPSEAWSTLTPSATFSGATTDHTASFGISIVTITESSATASASANAKRAVQQISDGQIQEQTSVTLASPSTTTAAAVVNQISDGQIQHQTSTSTTATAAVVNQIGDGQIQHQTTTATPSAAVVNQIGDGQIQHQTSTVAAGSAVNQISDGQIQHQTASVAAQISDGQVQASGTAAAQISDGQVQATGTASAEAADEGYPVACLTSSSLAMTLNDSILTDSKGRIGAIVANRQFQFDGPPPQAGSIYAAGWSITSDGYLAIGDNDVFYQCMSGDFYNLYDQTQGAQCEPVYLQVVDFVSC